jgi:ADP-ribose pyrophosphatase YjhB (NUDIX family)
MVKVYFGNKPLFLSDYETEEIKPFLTDPGTIIIKKITASEITSVIKKMQDSSVKAGIIFHPVAEALDAVSKQFTIIKASGGFIYNNNKVLLIFRRKKWDLPKGKLDVGEVLVACALREVKEETGLSEVAFEQSLCITYHTYYEQGKHILKESHWHLLQGNDTEVLIPQTDEDIEKCEWVETDNLTPYLDNAPASIIDVIKEGLSVLTKKINQAIK